MMNNYIKNICLICFALFGPIYLPAGGIQRSVDEYSNIDKSKEIVLNSTNCLYCSPYLDSKKLQLFKSGTSVSILRFWLDSNSDKWIRVELARNIFSNISNKPLKGWMKL